MLVKFDKYDECLKTRVFQRIAYTFFAITKKKNCSIRFFLGSLIYFMSSWMNQPWAEFLHNKVPIYLIYFKKT